MRLALQIISWVMLVIGAIAAIDLLVQTDQGVSGDVPGLVIALIWMAQSVITLVYVHESQEVE